MTGNGLGGKSGSLQGQIPSVCHHIQIVSGTHTGSYSVGAVGYFPRNKELVCEADHSPLPSAEFKNLWSSPLLPLVFMAWCLSAGMALPQIKQEWDLGHYLL